MNFKAQWSMIMPRSLQMIYSLASCILIGAMNMLSTLQWRHNEHDRVCNHQPHDCLLNHLFRRRSKKTSKLRVTGLCVGNSPGTGEFPAQMASNAKNVSIWWRHHDVTSNSAVITRLTKGCLLKTFVIIKWGVWIGYLRKRGMIIDHCALGSV